MQPVIQRPLTIKCQSRSYPFKYNNYDTAKLRSVFYFDPHVNLSDVFVMKILHPSYICFFFNQKTRKIIKKEEFLNDCIKPMQEYESGR